MKNTKSNRMNATERKQKRVNENEREEIIKDDSKSLTILCMSSVSMQHQGPGHILPGRLKTKVSQPWTLQI